MTSPTKPMSFSDVEKAKQTVRTELDEHEATTGDARARLKYALAQVRDLEEAGMDHQRVRRYVFVLSALVSHERHGGLTARDLAQLVSLAYSILDSLNIKPKASRWASLYGDIHLIRSQIYRKEGRQWLAAWEQDMALTTSGSWPSGGGGFQSLVMATRVLRLGHGHLAVHYFEKANMELPPQYRVRWLLNRLLCAWLMGNEEYAADLAREVIRDTNASADEYREASWHLLRQEARQTNDLSILLAAIKKGRTHYSATYILEACAWAFVHPERQYRQRLPSLRHLARNQTLKPQRLGAWYKVMLTMQECYDQDINSGTRLRNLVDALGEREQFLTVDKELLGLAAAIRWLARVKNQSLANLSYATFSTLGFSLTDGAMADPLGLLPDAPSRAWFMTTVTGSS